MSNFDLAVIGGGPAGYVAAERAAAGGLRVVLFERRELGGVCLNEGCIPTKTLLYSAKAYDGARHADKYGVSVGDVAADYGKIVQRKNKVVRKLVAGVKAKLAGIEIVRGVARVVGREGGGFVTEAAAEDDTTSTYTSDKLLICTGAQAFVPPIPGVETALTSREVLGLKELPASVVIIGGGVIGTEFASVFNSLGSQVTVVEQMDEILGANDKHISEMLRSVYAKRGIVFHLSATVTRVDGGDVYYTSADGFSATVSPEGQSFTKGGEVPSTTEGPVEQKVSGEKVLVCIGRRPTTQGFGLETLDIQLNKYRGIATDKNMRTSVDGVYAAGDVTGFSMLAHTASREAEVAVNHILGVADEMSYDAVPAIVYTNPEVASVGLTLAGAQAKGLSVKELSLPMAYSGRFVAENEGGEGLCKVVVVDVPSGSEKQGQDWASKACCATAKALALSRKSDSQAIDGQVVGVHMIGNPSSEIIWGAALAIEKKMTLCELQKLIFPHPTVSEIIREVAFCG